jgi:CPA1 family monovalent cation:H+ antiporter
MPLVIRFLDLERDHHADAEEARARIHAAEAALGRLEELIEEEWVPQETAERLRGLYAFRHGRYTARHAGDDESIHEEQQQAYQRLRRELIQAERDVLHELRRQGVITEQVAQRVVYDIDLEDIRLDP